MAVVRYGNMMRQVNPSRTNIVRGQTAPMRLPSPGLLSEPTASSRDYDPRSFNEAIMAATAPVAQPRQTLSSTPANQTPPIDINKIVSDALAGIDFGVNLPTVVSGGGTGATSNQLFQQAQAAADARARQEDAARGRLATSAQAEALRGLLATPTGAGSFREGADRLLDLLSGYETTARTGITDARTAAENLLGQQYGRASGLLFGAPAQGETPAVTGAFPALTAYLQANAPRAFADTPVQAAPAMQNALAQYMQGQGVATTGVDEAVAAENAALQAGQGNFAGLLDVLRRQETASQQSRLAEAEQAGTVARTLLEAQRAAQAGGITQQEQAALSTLAQALLGQRVGVEQGAEQRRTGLQDALTSLLGTGFDVTGQQIAEEIRRATVPPKKKPAKKKTTKKK